MGRGARPCIFGRPFSRRLLLLFAQRIRTHLRANLASVQKSGQTVTPMAARPLSRASRATAARARRVRCDELEQKIPRLWNTSPPHNPAARQVTPSTMNIFESGSRCAAASAAVHGAAAALISPRTPPTRAPPRPHATCALLSHPPPVCAARRSRSYGAGPRGSSGAARPIPTIPSNPKVGTLLRLTAWHLQAEAH